LLGQILRLDFPKVDQWVAEFVKKSTYGATDPDISPAASCSPNPVNTEHQSKYATAIDLGGELISPARSMATTEASRPFTKAVLPKI
jgi:hypothetical protein